MCFYTSLQGPKEFSPKTRFPRRIFALLGMVPSQVCERNGAGALGAADIQGRLASCNTNELRPHPSYVRHGLSVHAAQLSALASSSELAFREPIVITRNHTIIDGYARWKLAQQQGRTTFLCIEYDLTEAKALRWLIQSHRPSRGLNAFSRVVLALDLEPLLHERAQSNQQAGGQYKGSSYLTEAERVDVRSEIAAVAGVSVGNVTKVKQLAKTAHPDVLQALRNGEISIHRAWLWSKEPLEKQRKALLLCQSEKGVKKTIRTLLRRHRPKSSPIVLDMNNLVERLSMLESSQLALVSVAVIDAPGSTVFLTEELFRSFGSQGDLTLL